MDLSRLNRYVKRERYQSSTPAQAVADIAAEEANPVDVLKGYHQCPLDEASQILTTFITPFGRFQFLRAPFGISSIPEHYNRRMDEAFAGLEGYRRIVDDVVIFDKDKEQHESHVRQFLQHCSKRRITLNAEKWEYAQSEVDFAGYHLSASGYCVDSSIVAAITRFPTPTSRTDIRSFVGLVNQLSASTPAVAGLLAPLRPLLSTKNEFLWSAALSDAFESVKQALTSPPTLSFFDPARSTCLCTDASRLGLGFVLQQRSGEAWVLVQAGSRFLSDAESRYAIIELEMLAVSWAVSKCRLAGLPHFQVVTDHHPLIPILNTHRLDEVENPRLQRLKTRVMGYNFVSDPLPLDLHAERDPGNEPEVTIADIRAMSCSQESLRLHELRRHAEEDCCLQQLRHYVLAGFPEHRSQLPEVCRPFWNIRNQLTLDDDLLVYGCRLLIPAAMRQEVLRHLHESHQGLVRTKQRARLIVYWPGLDNDIDNIISSPF